MQDYLPYIFSILSALIAGVIHQPEQAFSLGWDNEMILIYVPQPWLLDLYNEEPGLFS